MDERQLSAVLVDFASTLTADFSLQRTLDHLIERVVKVLPVTGAGVLLMDSENEGHHFVAATDEVIRRIEGLQLDLGEGPCLQAYRTGRSVVVTDLSADREFVRFSPRAVQAGLGAVFGFPLRLDEERLGALELYTTEAAELSERDLSAAQTLADVMAAYLFNARARGASEKSMQILEAQALHDPLTGLPNRVLLHDRLTQALRSARRSETIVEVLFLDVDGLKAVNDTYGHHVGDELLVQVARRVLGILRPGDTLARLSGDEFVVVCEGMTERGQAGEVAARILDTLSVPVEVYGTALVASVSIGAVCAEPGARTVADVLAQADAAMYEAKRQGGGQLVNGDGPLHTPAEPTGAASHAGRVRVEADDSLAVQLGGEHLRDTQPRTRPPR